MSKIIKMQYKSFRYFVRRYVNGAKGFLSIFLALTVSPLLLCTFMFIEYARYQSINELMQEVMGSSLFSTLGSYDGYLDERFDLMAVSQEADINSLYQKYATANTASFGKSVTLSEMSAQGQHDLGKGDILKQQLYEASEKPVLAQTLWDGFDVDSIIGQLNESLKLEQFSRMAQVADNAATLGDDATKMIKAAIDASAKAKTYSTNYDQYDAAAEKFRAALAAVEAARDTGGSTLAAAEAAAQDAAKEYAAAAEKLNESLGDLSDTLGDLIESAGKLDEDMQKLSGSYKKAKKEKDYVETDSTDWLHMLQAKVADFAANYISQNRQSKVNEEQAKFRTQMASLNTFVASGQGVSAMSTEPYKPITVESVGRNIQNPLSNLVYNLNHSASDNDGALEGLMKIGELALDLLDIQFLYDGNLNSKIDTSKLVHMDSYDTSSLLAASGLAGVLNDSLEFLNGILNKDVLKMITSFVSFMVNVAKFLLGIIAWIIEHFVNLVRFVGQPKEYYHAFLLYGYAAYNLPNRTTYMEGSTLSDYEFKKIFNLAGGNYNTDSGGSLKDIMSIQDGSGTDPMFKGAELEYMLTGATSEYAAQTGAFVDGYMLRMATDAVAVLNSDILEALTVTGPGRIAATIIFLVLEPLIDMIVLVNDGKEPLFKKVAYLSLEGIPYLVKDLAKVPNLSESMKDDIDGRFKNMVDTINKPIKEAEKESKENKKRNKNQHGSQDNPLGEEMSEDNGLFMMDYTGHGAILLILCTPLEDYTKRMQNLIQTEAKEYYKGKLDFSIDKTYTSIHSNTEYHLNPFMGLSPSLTGGFPMKKERDLAY